MQPPVTAPQDPASFLPYSVATLADGREAVIRPMNPSDFEAEREFITALSPESRRFRFQEQVVASDELVAQLAANPEVKQLLQNDPAAQAAPVVLLRYRFDAVRLALFVVIASLHAPLDTRVEHLRVEFLVPADAATEQWFRDGAAVG